MSTTYSGNFTLTESNPSLGDGDETGFTAQASLSITLTFSFDSDGDVVGSGVVSGQFSGYAIGDQDGDDDGFSDYASNTPLSVGGSLAGGLTAFGSFGAAGYVNYQGVFSSDASSLSGTASVEDFDEGTEISGALSLGGTALGAIPSLAALAALSQDSYSSSPSGTTGFTPLSTVQNALGQIVNYANADGSQIVIAVEGTNPANAQDLWADLASFPSGNPTSGLSSYVAALAADIQQIRAANPNATITLTGHSLGGAVAQMVGEYTGFATTTFNAPGAQQLYANTAIQNLLAPLAGDVAATPATNINYRAEGDIVSLLGTPLGNTQTVVPASSANDTVWQVFSNHSIANLSTTIASPNAVIQDGTVEPNANVAQLAAVLFTSGQTVVTTVSQASSAVAQVYTETVESVTSTVSSAVDFLGNEYSAWIDPEAAIAHVFSLNQGSPQLTSVTFEADPNVSSFEVWHKTNSGWSAATIVTAGQLDSIAGGTSAIVYQGLSSAGQPVAGGDPSLFYATFTGAGTVKGSIASAGIGGLPDVSDAFTASIDAIMQSVLNAAVPANTLASVVTVSGAGSVASAMAGVLNAYVVNASIGGGVFVAPGGYGADYVLGGAVTLQDGNGGVALIAANSGATLKGAGNDTLFGGNGGDTLMAGAGAETLIGGTGTNDFFLGSSTAQVTSQGNDTITGSSGAETVNASGSALYFGNGGATDFIASGTGGDTVIGGANGNTVQGAGGAQLVFASSTLNYTGGAGAATIIGGSGGNTVTGGSGGVLAFASSSMTYTGTGGEATVIGGGGPLTAALGTGGGVAYGGSAGGDNLSTASNTQSVLVGGGAGDVLAATGSGSDLLVAGAGAETINGAGATGSLVIFGGPGNDVLSGGTGNDLFVPGLASATLTGGGGSNFYVFLGGGTTTRTDLISDFNPNKDAIALFGYGAEPGADAAALASAAVVGSNTVVTLTDGTSIQLAGAPTLQPYNFF